VDDLLAENERLTISLKTRSGLSRLQSSSAWDKSTIPPPRDIELSYPGSNAQDARKFSWYLHAVAASTNAS
jgi:meiotic recombination protein SPO11